MFFQLLKRSLNDLPGLQIALFRLSLYVWVLKRITFEYVRAHQERRAIYGVHTCLGVVDDDPVGDHAPLQPGDEVQSVT
ncbi:hypothetical protein ALP33_102786 [Pseudomonas amygdali pv. lachrymans]|uniref:Uncharacterized protein n=1 Tax=Pseudomonas amygdali pv. lachrymans TaxID=53707 RepID=A0AB37RAI2_PSEAV|nr:hypothetical protein ALQ79_102789 [Pseudomonas amygdali pv. lachrymans]RMT01617.1 hypothetical protein ALP54_102715 [Pseudomonas amygdali pv. lachrymans]RMU23132.1 hypothetical protein ALP33_102786 [Pseudomonas amygdali pv. lachrymans]